VIRFLTLNGVKAKDVQTELEQVYEDGALEIRARKRTSLRHAGRADGHCFFEADAINSWIWGACLETTTTVSKRAPFSVQPGKITFVYSNNKGFQKFSSPTRASRVSLYFGPGT
jgi:hypothetical protein